jgi:hypothetical protein
MSIMLQVEVAAMEVGARDFSLLHNVQTISGVHSLSSIPGWKSCGGVNLTTHLHPVPRLRIMELYFYSPIYLHGVMLN